MTFIKSFAVGACLGIALYCFMALATGCGKTQPGPAGARGDTGVAGTNGHDGATGAVGPQGAPGSDASSVTVVPLCPSATTYPSTFTEISFCVAGKLYGTYSDHGGFSTELPPGNYHSYGINSTCNFTVVTGCQVSF